MIEFILGAFLYATIGFSIRWWKISFNKEQYNLLPIFKSWQVYLPLGCAVFYIFLEITVWARWYWFVPYQQIFKTVTLLSYLPLILKYKLYESINIKLRKNELISLLTSPMVIGTLCIAIGTMLNLIAIRANNGFMPIFPSNTIATGYITKDLFNDGLHILGGFDTKLIPLCDWIDTGIYIASPADILIRMYAFIMLYYSIKKTNNFGGFDGKCCL